MPKINIRQAPDQTIELDLLDIDFSAPRFDDPRYEFMFRAKDGETVEGYCARRAAERARECRKKDKEIKALKAFILEIKAAIDSGKLVDPTTAQISYSPAKWPPEVLDGEA